MASSGRRPHHVLVNVACLVIVIAGLKVAQAVLVPLVLAAFLALLTAPFVVWARSFRVPLWTSVTAVAVGVMGVLSFFAGVVVTSMTSFVAGWPAYAVRLDAFAWRVSKWLDAHGIHLNRNAVSDALEPSALVGVASTTLSGIAGLLGDTTVVVLVLVFILLEVTDFPSRLRRAWSNPQADLSAFERISTEVRRYIVLKTYVSLAIGVAVYVLLAVLEVDFAELLALIAFLFNFIPNIGAFVAAVPTVALALLQYDIGTAALVAGGIFAIHMVIGNIIEPQLQGNRFGISVLVVVVSLVVWGYVWGVAGMILSLPLTMAMKIAFEQIEEYRWIAALMDPPPVSPLLRISLRPPPTPPPPSSA
ncbi:MAG: AI-2E family transporter [Polyangiaceae bacterium]|nr:AI-2E family transporter [Polyangiaceae bacterium]